VSDWVVWVVDVAPSVNSLETSIFVEADQECGRDKSN